MSESEPQNLRDRPLPEDAPPGEASAETTTKGKPVPRTRTGAAHASLITGVLLLVLLLVFILENTQSVKISYFGASGHLALGIALLVAAVGGALLVGIVGTARIAQVRRIAKRRRS
jgi:lipopolysaccharide assembly protein A